MVQQETLKHDAQLTSDYKVPHKSRKQVVTPCTCVRLGEKVLRRPPNPNGSLTSPARNAESEAPHVSLQSSVSPSSKLHANVFQFFFLLNASAGQQGTCAAQPNCLLCGWGYLNRVGEARNGPVETKVEDVRLSVVETC